MTFRENFKLYTRKLINRFFLHCFQRRYLDSLSQFSHKLFAIIDTSKARGRRQYILVVWVTLSRSPKHTVKCNWLCRRENMTSFRFAMFNRWSDGLMDWSRSNHYQIPIVRGIFMSQRSKIELYFGDHPSPFSRFWYK